MSTKTGQAQIAPSNQALADPVSKLDIALTGAKTAASCVAHLGYVPLIGASTIVELIPYVSVIPKIIWFTLPDDTDGKVYAYDDFSLLMSIPLGGAIPIGFSVGHHLVNPKMANILSPDAGIKSSLPLTSTLANRAISNQSNCLSYASQLKNEYQQYNVRASSNATKESSNTEGNARVGERKLNDAGYYRALRNFAGDPDYGK